MTERPNYVVGQRVRVKAEPDDVGPGTYAGKMAIIEKIECLVDGETNCVLKIDRLSDPVSLPLSFLEPLVTHGSSLLANDLW